MNQAFKFKLARTPESGRIRMADDIIRYDSQDYGSWEFPVHDLRVIGEYTTDHGPFADDWFLVFVTESSTIWYEASQYAKEMDRFWTQLSEILGATQERSELCSSTNFAHRVIWPSSLQGQPLFHVEHARYTWWRRLLGIEQMRLELADAVIDYAAINTHRE